jgi:tRNA threonylcarbamoyladenosine biosynthesis protein TsaE
MRSARVRLSDEAASIALGRALASLMRRGLALCLFGELGAGKSTLARALIRALTRPDEDVPSPTFTLVQTYEGALTLAHFDLYRLGDASEVDELGLHEALEDGAAIIEWPERLDGDLPPDRIEVHLAHAGEGREARLRSLGQAGEGLKDALLAAGLDEVT